MLANSGYEGFIKEHEKTIQALNTNNMPKKQTSFEEQESAFYDCVKSNRGCPIGLRTDCGTENGVIFEDLETTIKQD